MEAKLISQRPGKLPGKIHSEELFFNVPHDYDQPSKGTLRIFARSAHRAASHSSEDPNSKRLPWLVYLTGGPGFGCRLPQDTAFLGPLLDRGYRVLLLDYRGTGLSTLITAQTLALQGNTEQQVQYLTKFRADSIVRDCEAIRHCLTADLPEGDRKWTLLGQSFGGFTCVTYLSLFPDGLKEVFITGGIPPSVDEPTPVYRQTYERVIERNEAYYTKFPEDIPKIRRICQYLQKTKPKVGSGYLSARRFQQLGIQFGNSGGLDRVHDIVLRTANELEVFDFVTYPTLCFIDSCGGFDEAPIYALFQEPIYCQGQASNWTAERFRKADPRFNIDGNESTIYFTGEMVYRDMFDSYNELKAMKDVAESLASFKDWPSLYDKAQLMKNEVPVYASIYVEDMYVDYSLALETAKNIKGLKKYITNIWYHGALRQNSEALLQELFKLKDDVID